MGSEDQKYRVETEKVSEHSILASGVLRSSWALDGERSENSRTVQQETRPRKQRRGEDTTVDDPAESDAARLLLLDTDEEDGCIQTPLRTVWESRIVLTLILMEENRHLN